MVMPESHAIMIQEKKIEDAVDRSPIAIKVVSQTFKMKDTGFAAIPRVV